MAFITVQLAAFLSAAAFLALYFAGVLVLILYGARLAAPLCRWLDRVPKRGSRPRQKAL